MQQQKKWKVLFVLAITFFMFNQFVYATDIDPSALSDSYNSVTDTNSSMNSFDILNNTTNITNSIDDSINNTITNSISNSVSNTTRSISNSTTPTTTSSSSLPEASLGFTNILNIVLIVIGLLLFFLGIAILIRLK